MQAVKDYLAVREKGRIPRFLAKARGVLLAGKRGVKVSYAQFKIDP